MDPEQLEVSTVEQVFTRILLNVGDLSASSLWTSRSKEAGLETLNSPSSSPPTTHLALAQELKPLPLNFWDLVIFLQRVVPEGLSGSMGCGRARTRWRAQIARERHSACLCVSYPVLPSHVGAIIRAVAPSPLFKRSPDRPTHPTPYPCLLLCVLQEIKGQQKAVQDSTANFSFSDMLSNALAGQPVHQPQQQQQQQRAPAQQGQRAGGGATAGSGSSSRSSGGSGKKKHRS